MAQRRMFSKDITEHDSFLEMPLSTQSLYFHLGMQADDDGFVSPNRIMRMIGAQKDDMKILITKRFVLPFDDGIVVIKHWKMNNYLRPDRYKATKHQDKMALLKEKSNGSYSWYTTGIPNDIPVVDAGKVRLGKDSIFPETSSGDLSDNSKDMGWNKQADDYEEGVVDFDSGDLHDPVAEAKEKNKEMNDKFRASIDWLIKHQGRDPKRTSIPKQLKAIQKLYTMGVSASESKQIIIECEGSDVWKGKLEKPDFWTVVSIIQKRG